MNRHAINAFMSEIRWQSQIAIWCYDELRNDIALRRRHLKGMNEFLATMPETLADFTPEDRKKAETMAEEISTTTIRTLMHLQGFLAAAGVISEIFWPNITKGAPVEIRARERRSRELRSRTKTADDSALRFRPGGADDARGGLLHVDEMIDNALAVGHSQRVDRFMLGSFEGMAESFGWNPSQAVRALDDEKLILAVRARQTDLTAVDAEVRRLNANIRKAVFLRLESVPSRGPGERNVGLSFGTANVRLDELTDS